MLPRSRALAAALASPPHASATSLRQLDACALPPSRLFLSTTDSAACDDGGSLSAPCLSACSCRLLTQHDGQDAALCVGDSLTDCPFVSCHITATSRRLADAHNGLPVWAWIVIGVGALLLLAAVVFLVNYCRHRPLKGDNRTEVADAERIAQRRKDARAAARRDSAATTQATRTRETNASVASGENYHGVGGLPSPPALRFGSPLVGTELAVSLYPSERVFSPISDESKASSEFSQGVDDDPSAVLRAPLVRPGDEMEESDVDSLSCGFTVDEESKRSDSSAVYPRKKSIEF